MTPPEPNLDTLVEQVMQGAKYRSISPQFIRSLLSVELEKRSTPKEAVKAARGRLHQVAAAYQEKPIPYASLLTEMEHLPVDNTDPEVLTFLQRAMSSHASTRERIPILQDFFTQCLAPLGSIHSILDVACGLNPLTIPWMPLPPGCTYTACDIYTDLVDFLNTYFTRFAINGEVLLCDVTRDLPAVTADLTLVLKTIPCLEQIDKEAGKRLMDSISSPNILVSFPAHSLGGRPKGMVRNYECHFSDLVAGRPWRITRFEFPGELAFLVQK